MWSAKVDIFFESHPYPLPGRGIGFFGMEYGFKREGWSLEGRRRLGLRVES
jgi:hypothetical protein